MTKRLSIPILLLVPLFAVAQPVQQIGGNITAATTNCSNGAGCVVAVLPTQNGNPNAGVASIVLGGTYSGTNQFEKTAGPAKCDPTVADNATGACTWVSATGFPQPSGSSVTSATGTGTWLFDITGMIGVRVRNSTYSSGTVVTTITPSVTNPIFAAPAISGSLTIGGPLGNQTAAASVAATLNGQGAQTAANSTSVVPASNSGNFPVSIQSGAADNTTTSPANGQLSTTCSSINACSAGSTVAITMAGYASMGFGVTVPSGSSATLICDYSTDGQTWRDGLMWPYSSLGANQSSLSALSATNYAGLCQLPGATLQARIRASAIGVGGGNVVITERASTQASCSAYGGIGGNQRALCPSVDASGNTTIGFITTSIPASGGTSVGNVNAPLPVFLQGLATSAVNNVVACDSIAQISVAAAATTVIVTGVASKKIYICGGFLSTTLAGTFQWSEATTAGSCASPTTLSPAVNLAANGTGFGSGIGMMFKTNTAAKDLCLTSATGTTVGWISYTTNP